MGRAGKKKWRKNLADLFEMPQEIVLDLPRLTLIGNLQCYLENHRGIIEYTDERVRVSVNGGEITVSGQRLVIRYLENEEIAIDGTILSMTYDI